MQLLLGNFGSGKTSFIIQESVKHLSQNKSIWIIVPSRHHKDQLYSQLLMQNKGLIGNPIITLSELQKILLDHIFPNPLLKPQTINNFEKFLILSNIIQENSEQFLAFKNIKQRPEMIKMIYRLIQSIRDKDIIELNSTPELADKIHDIRLILALFQEILQENNLCDNNFEVDLICQYLINYPHHECISIFPDYIFVNGFVDYTSIQFKLIATFLMQADCHHTAYLTLVDNPHPICQTTIQEFQKKFPHAQVKKFSHISDSVQLANDFINNNYSCNKKNHLLEIYEIQAFGKYKEVEEIINQIKKLCLYENYTLSDIMIITNQQDRYYPLLSSILYKTALPFTFSKDILLVQNPLIIFIQKCLELMHSSLNHENLEFFAHSNYVKSEICSILSKAPELIPFAINGKTEEWEQGFLRQEEINPNISHDFFTLKITINELCNKLFILEPFKNHSISFYIQHLLNLLEFLGISDSLSQDLSNTQYKILIAKSIAKDYAALSKFKEILQNLTKSLESIHKAQLPFNKFLFFLNTLISETRYRSEIPKINVLRILSPEDARGSYAKAVFILGMNEGEYPSIPKYELFDNQDRHNLNAISKKILGQALWQTDIEYFSKEKLSFIVALTRATQKIFFSRTPANEKGNYFGISHFLQQILEQNSFTRIPEYPQAPTKSHWDNPKIFEIHSDVTHYYEYKYISIPNLPKPNMQNIQKSIDYINIIKEANLYFDRGQLPSVQARNYFGYIPTLSPIIDKYMQSHIPISPTGLEKIGRCRYQGLWQEFWKLKTYKLPEIKPEAADYGNLYHHVLELYIEQTKDKHDEEFYDNDLLHNILTDYISHSSQDKIFCIDYEYLFTMISLFLQNIEIQFRENQEALYFELQSGNEILPNKNIPLNSDISLIINSRIDRINTGKYQPGYYIIDYKKTGVAYKDYQKTPFNLFQGFLYAALLKANGKTPINEISYIFLEKQEIFNEFPHYKKNGALFHSIEELYHFKAIEILQLLSLLAEGNFSPFTLEEDIGHSLKELFIDKFGENFPYEYSRKCSYCELKNLCLRKTKKIQSY